MPNLIKHTHVLEALPVELRLDNDRVTTRCSASGEFSVAYPGKFHVNASASYAARVFVVGSNGSGDETHNDQHGRWETHLMRIPLTVDIKTPDRQPFNANQVTIADINRHRDLRGTTVGPWSYSVTADSVSDVFDPLQMRLIGESGRGTFGIAVEETVASESAPPLVDTVVPAGEQRAISFDLYRVGTLIATSQEANGSMVPRTMSLQDPSGGVVATSDTGELTCPITLRTLDKSRDAAGDVRPWSLVVLPSPQSGGASTVRATVVETARINTGILQDRIDTLIGARGKHLSIYAETDNEEMVARLQILDAFTAEMFDRYELLETMLGRENPSGVQRGVLYTLGTRNRDYIGYGTKISLHGLKVSTIDVSFGMSERIQPPVPALKIAVGVEGHLSVDLGGHQLATVKVRGGSIAVETGTRVEADGTFSPVVWVADDLVDVDLGWHAAVTAGVLSPELLVLGELFLEGRFEEKINELAHAGISSVLMSMAARVPEILNIFLGARLTFQPLRVESDNIAFDYVSPVEPQAKPAEGYVGIMGRAATQLGPEVWNLRPPLMGNTWKADNLAKIDHIVMVMMENRSFDHVMGYLAQAPGGEASDGLTPELMAALTAAGYPLVKLNERAFKTKFPKSVGHSLGDVRQQLGEPETRLLTPSGRSVNHPKGFVDNFTRRAMAEPAIDANDVLGYYEGGDLPFFKYLAENYAYCERFFCSHAGPTLPNRMLWLTGDVQYDRVGEAILNNNSGDNFLLSRATTMFDLLTRKGVEWRVYESYPSVAMLRMFARYATDDTHIVPIDRLADDVNRGDLPAVTVIEPAMHHPPENDDHPPLGDMYLGQRFLKQVYDTLRSNDELWRKTMLIITYDEHGGFYDHAIPPLAEARSRRMQIVRDPTVSTSPSPHPLVTTYGVRVPAFVVSPWVPAGRGPQIVLDHCSMTKTVLARFCGEDKPFLSDRVHASRSFEAYVSEATPRMDVPPSPSLAPIPVQPTAARVITTAPVSRKQMREENVDFHDLTGMIGRMLGRDFAMPSE